jgi:hypothetical protein
MGKRKDLIAIIILLLVIVIRFSPFIFMGRPLNTDSWKAYYPWQEEYKDDRLLTINYDSNMEYGTWFPMVKESLKRGEFPLWNPYSGCGMPMYSDHLIPIFHIPFAVALLFPADLISAAYAFFMAITGTLFFYWFFRNWRFSVFVSLFGGLTYFLSGWQMYLYPPEVASLIWIPAILLFHDRFLESNRLSDACWGAFFVAQLLIGGYPVMIAHFFYVVLAYMIWRRFSRHFQWKASVNRWILAILIMAIFGSLISAVQNYPTCKLAKLSSRSMTSDKQYMKTTGELIREKQDEIKEKDENTGEKRGLAGVLFEKIKIRSQLFIPFYDPDFDFSRRFFGSIAFVIALVGLFYGAKRFKFIKVVFVIFGIFFILEPLCLLISRIIPGWTISPLIPREVFIFLLIFSSVIGLDRICSISAPDKSIGRFISACISIISVLLIAFLAALHVNLLGDLVKDKVVFLRWNPTSDSIFILLYVLFSLVILAVMALYCCKPLRFKNSFKTASTLLIANIILCLLAHVYLYPYFSMHEFMPESDGVKRIASVIGNDRFVRYSTEESRQSFDEHLTYILPPNTPSRFKLMDSLGYDNMLTGDYEKFMNMSAPGSLLRGRGAFQLMNSKYLHPNGFFMQATGTRYVMEKPEETDSYPYSNEIYEAGGIRIYDVYGSQSVISLQVRLFGNYILEKDYKGDILTDNFANKVILDRVPMLPGNRKLDTDSYFVAESSKLIDFQREPMSVRIDVDLLSDCILYLADSYHPGWHASIDGEKVDIIKSNYNFRAIAVPSGKHTVYMWFDGKDVITGGFVSSISLVVLILIGLAGLDFRLRKNNPEMKK